MRSRIGQTCRLRLRKRHRRVDRRYFASTGAAVITHPIYIEMIARSRCIDFEEYDLANIYADVRRESLDIAGSRPRNLPVRVSRKLIFAGYRISARLCP